MAINYKIFFDRVRPLFGGRLTPEQVKGLQAALEAAYVPDAPTAPAGPPDVPKPMPKPESGFWGKLGGLIKGEKA